MNSQAIDGIRESNQVREFHIVVIEWDGEKPPRQWYRRLKRLAGGVRGDKKVNPIERRADKGIIIQEGCILTPSYSLARALAIMARDDFGARAVELGTTALKEHFGATAADLQIMGRVEAKLSMRGRPVDPVTWVVTCHEEMDSFETYESRPIQCPSCSGLRIHVRRGYLRKRSDNDRDIMNMWESSRFLSLPHWEKTPINYDVDNTSYPLIKEYKYIEYDRGRHVDKTRLLIRQSTEFLTAVRSINDRSFAVDVLDAVYVARQNLSKPERLEARVKAATLFFRLGGDPVSIEMVEDESKVDFLDAAALLGEETAVQLLMRYA